MTEVGEEASIYDLYDRLLAALREGDGESLRSHFAPRGAFSLGRELDPIDSSEPDALIDAMLEEAAAGSESLELGLDVLAVARRNNEAVTLVEAWVDVRATGRRRTRLAIETLARAPSGGWWIIRSVGEESRSSLR